MSEPTPLPDWVATLVGQLVIENEALRRALAELSTTRPPPESDAVG